HERTEAQSRAGWVGPTADDKLVDLDALGFEPVERAAGPVGPVSALGDNPFQAELAALAEELRTVAFEVVGVLHDPFPVVGKQRRQLPFAVVQRKLPLIAAV